MRRATFNTVSTWRDRAGAALRRRRFVERIGFATGARASTTAMGSLQFRPERLDCVLQLHSLRSLGVFQRRYLIGPLRPLLVERLAQPLHSVVELADLGAAGILLLLQPLLMTPLSLVGSRPQPLKRLAQLDRLG